MKRNSIALTALLLAAASTACAGPKIPVAEVAARPASMPPLPLAPSPSVASNLPVVLVHKSPTCGCCGAWVEHLRNAGFRVDVRDSDDLDPIKRALGIPADKTSCHTAQVGDYFVEGHVPADDIKRLLAEHPDARGLAVPGMPLSSPGMEAPDGSAHPYSVELIATDGSSTAFAEH